MLASVIRFSDRGPCPCPFPCGGGNTGSRIVRSTKAVTSCPHKGNRNPRPNVRTNFRVRSMPLGREKRSHAGPRRLYTLVDTLFPFAGIYPRSASERDHTYNMA